MTDEEIMTLDQQIVLLAKYIEVNHPDDIKDDERVVETAIKIMERLKVQNIYIKEMERQIVKFKEERSKNFDYIQKLENGLDTIKKKLECVEDLLRTYRFTKKQKIEPIEENKNEYGLGTS